MVLIGLSPVTDPRLLQKRTRSQGPLLRRHYPASPLIRPCPTPAMAIALRNVEAATLANDGSPPITRTTFPTCRAHLYGAFFVKISAGAILFIRQFLCSIWSPFLRPDPQIPGAVARRGLSRLAVAPTLPRAPIIARPHLDSSEHGGTLVVVGMTINEGSAPFAAVEESRRILVSGRLDQSLNHDAIMRISGEAPRRRAHSTPRLDSQVGSRVAATSNRHRRPVASVQTGPKLPVYLQRAPFIVLAVRRRPLAPRHLAQSATGRSKAYAPRRRS